jgi:hypothetical protein
MKSNEAMGAQVAKRISQMQDLLCKQITHW